MKDHTPKAQTEIEAILKGEGPSGSCRTCRHCIHHKAPNGTYFFECEKVPFYDGGFLQVSPLDYCQDYEEGKWEGSKKSETTPLVNLRKVLDTQVGGQHYQQGGIQPIEYIQANNLTFLEGDIVKRITRYKYKDGLKDLLKAMQELSFLAAYEYGHIVRIVEEQK